jgi:hypothetical protein
VVAIGILSHVSKRMRTETLRLVVVLAMLMVTAAVARADLIVSLGTTANVTCSGGTCAATAANAVLNAGTLQTMLASGNVAVTTGSVANRLVVHAPLFWSSKSTLSLYGRQQISIEALVVVRGFGGIALSTANATELGNLAYTARGRVAFTHPLSRLTVNGLRYKLVNDIAGLAAAASANPNARIALANNYDAKPDGAYTTAPVPTFNGLFEGLGNTISHLTVSITSAEQDAGLFGSVGKGCTRCGRVNGINLTGISIHGYGENSTGGLIGVLDAELTQSSSRGTVTSGVSAMVGGLVGSTSKNALIAQSHSDVGVTIHDDAIAGGLVGQNQGMVRETYSLGAVASTIGSTIGGLVGVNSGSLRASFAAGSLTADGHKTIMGGLVGVSSANIENCYAIGAVTNNLRHLGSSPENDVGGLVGSANAAILTSYSSGAIDGTSRDRIGGLVGSDGSGGMKRDYWDVSTSGVTNPSAGAGNIANDPGITGLTTAQFSAKLPVSFSPKVWALNPNVNGGLPYLIANPPP